MIKGIGIGLAGLMMAGALIGCGASYQAQARVTAATENAERSAQRAEAAARRAEQGASKVEAAAARVEAVVHKFESEQHGR